MRTVIVGLVLLAALSVIAIAVPTAPGTRARAGHLPGVNRTAKVNDFSMEGARLLDTPSTSVVE